MKGQSLIEVLVALAIISILITGVVSVVTSSLNNARYSQDQNSATKYAQEGLEFTRSVRNANYVSFATMSGNYCLSKNAVSLGPIQPSCSTPNVDHFIRSVEIELSPGCGTNVSKVIVTVSWTDGKCSTGAYCHKSELVTCLSRVSPT